MPTQKENSVLQNQMYIANLKIFSNQGSDCASKLSFSKSSLTFLLSFIHMINIFLYYVFCSNQICSDVRARKGYLKHSGILSTRRALGCLSTWGELEGHSEGTWTLGYLRHLRHLSNLALIRLLYYLYFGATV